MSLPPGSPTMRPEKRVVGSIAVALELVRQGVHVIRVHDVDETKQAIAVWKAINM